MLLLCVFFLPTQAKMPLPGMRIMHNEHDDHASREITPGRFDLLITFAAIAEEKSVTAAASRLLPEPARCKPSSPARTRTISRWPSGPVFEWLRTHVARPKD